jgi:hypothetical protein
LADTSTRRSASNSTTVENSVTFISPEGSYGTSQRPTTHSGTTSTVTPNVQPPQSTPPRTTPQSNQAQMDTEKVDYNEDGVGDQQSSGTTQNPKDDDPTGFESDEDEDEEEKSYEAPLPYLIGSNSCMAAMV